MIQEQGKCIIHSAQPAIFIPPDFQCFLLKKYNVKGLAPGLLFSINKSCE